MSEKVKPATPRACAHCPWRLSNQGKKPDPHGFYTKANLRRLWAGLKDGEAMTCHPTDDRMNEFEHAPRVGEDATTHECAGATIIVQREFMRFQEIALAAQNEGSKSGMRDYRALPGPRMTRNGIAEVVARVMFGSTPFAMEVGKPDLNDPDVQYLPLGVWEQR